jgi:hypothetical protein
MPVRQLRRLPSSTTHAADAPPFPISSSPGVQGCYSYNRPTSGGGGSALSSGEVCRGRVIRPFGYPGLLIGLALNSLLLGQEQPRQPFECLAAVLDL